MLDTLVTACEALRDGGIRRRFLGPVDFSQALLPDTYRLLRSGAPVSSRVLLFIARSFSLFSSKTFPCVPVGAACGRC